MFSKDNSSTQSAGGKKGKDVPLRKSDRRHLRQRVVETLAVSAAEDEARLDAVFLHGTLLSRNVTLPSTQERAVLFIRNTSDDENDTHWPYTHSPQVVWIQVDHGPHQPTSQVPTLALLSALLAFTTTAIESPKHGLPIVTVPHHVSKFLCRGAHLMKSGISRLDVPEQGHKTGLCVVQIAGNPQPLAVGWLDPSIKTATDFGPGTQGIGVHVVTSYGDDLWKQQCATSNNQGIVSSLGAPYNAGHYGNIGFCEGKFALPLVVEGNEEEEEPSDDKVATDDKAKDENATTKESGEVDQSANKVTAEERGAVSANDPNAETTETMEDALSPDNVLHQAVCRALARLSLKNDLPMPVSVFYAQHVLPNRPPGTTVQLKQTRFKKFGPYLQEQVERGLLQVGPDAAKKDPLAMLTLYDRRHADLRPHLPEAQQEQAAQIAAGKSRLVLLDLFVVPQHFVSLLRLESDVVKAAGATSEERRNTGYLTAKEVKDILDDYITRENLIHPAMPAKIVLDGPLCDALYKQKGKQQQESATPTEVSRKDLTLAWQAKMERAFALVQMPGGKILFMGRGNGPVVTMEVSKRQNKKFVTKIRGMEHFGIVAADLQHEIATRFACAASVEENPSEKLKKGHVELVLQGNLVDEVEALLLGDESLTSHGGARDSPYSIPKNAVEVVLRKGVPARKGRASSGKKQ